MNGLGTFILFVETTTPNPVHYLNNLAFAN